MVKVCICKGTKTMGWNNILKGTWRIWGGLALAHIATCYQVSQSSWKKKMMGALVMSETTAMSYLIHSAVLWSRHQHRQPCWSHRCTGHEAPVLATTPPRRQKHPGHMAVKGLQCRGDLDNFTPSDGGVLMVFASGPEMCRPSWVQLDTYSTAVDLWVGGDCWWLVSGIAGWLGRNTGQKHTDILLSTPLEATVIVKWILYPLR
jgi:hypothetical protein